MLFCQMYGLLKREIDLTQLKVKAQIKHLIEVNKQKTKAYQKQKIK